MIFFLNKMVKFKYTLLILSIFKCTLNSKPAGCFRKKSMRDSDG